LKKEVHGFVLPSFNKSVINGNGVHARFLSFAQSASFLGIALDRKES
jgi:hypothetical protein